VTKLSAAASSFEIGVSNDIAECDTDWTELEQHGVCTPFQTRAWLQPWYSIAGPHFGATPIIVTVRDRSSRAPLMMLPLCARRDGGLRTVEFADCGLSDYNAPLLAKHFAPDECENESLWRGIRAAIAHGDVMRFDKQPANILGHPNPLINLRGVKPMSLSSWGVHLPSKRSEFDQRIHGSTFGSQLTRKRRRIEGRGAVRFVHATSEAEGWRIFTALAEMRDRRFEELGRNNVLAEPSLKAFYGAVIFGNWAKNFATLSALEVEGEIIAALFALRHANNYLLLMPASKCGAWKSSSPGSLAIDYMASHLIDAGVSYFDLTIGNESYKRDFGATESALYSGVHPLSFAGWPAAMNTLLKETVRGSLNAPFAKWAVTAARRALRRDRS
jgi:CelD/BcsL family acetyltransferase involved in cellulose biosynthesis